MCASRFFVACRYFYWLAAMQWKKGAVDVANVSNFQGLFQMDLFTIHLLFFLFPCDCTGSSYQPEQFWLNKNNTGSCYRRLMFLVSHHTTHRLQMYSNRINANMEKMVGILWLLAFDGHWIITWLVCFLSRDHLSALHHGYAHRLSPHSHMESRIQVSLNGKNNLRAGRSCLFGKFFYLQI